MARCNRKSCAFNDLGRCKVLRKESARPNTDFCDFYKADIFAAIGNHPVFWLFVLAFIMILIAAISTQ